MAISASLELGFALVVEPAIGYGHSVLLWRLLFVRYNMYIWIGICFDRIVKNPVFWIPMAVISAVLAYIDIYVTSISPSYEFDGFNFFTTFYSIPVILLLRKIDAKWLRTLGKYSYEIFLVQMAVLALMPSFGINSIIGLAMVRIGMIAIASFFFVKLKEFVSSRIIHVKVNRNEKLE